MKNERKAISKVCSVYYFDGKSIQGLNEFLNPGKLSYDFIHKEPDYLAMVPDIAGETGCHYILRKDDPCYFVRFPGSQIERYSPSCFKKNFQLID